MVVKTKLKATCLSPVVVACAVGIAALAAAGCAQETYTIGDLSRGTASVERTQRNDPSFSTKIGETRAAPEKSWKPSVTNVPESGSKTSAAPRETAMLATLTNKRVKVSSIDGLTVKQFAELFFNQMLQVQVSIDPALQANKNKVFLLASGEVSGTTAVELAQAALQPHGIAVSYEKTGFVLKPIDAMLSDTPPTIVNRADAETPDDLKPVVQFVPLTAIEPNLAHQLLQSVTTKRVKVASLQSANSVVISGPSSDVSAAVSAVRTIDVPRYSGSKVASFTPTYVSAKAFSTGLTKVLLGEGYTVAATDNAAGAIKIVTVDAINSVVVFAQSDKLMARAMYWSEKLDKPADTGGDQKTFIYKAKNMAAEHLVNILTGVASKSSVGSSSKPTSKPSLQAGLQVASAGGVADVAATAPGGEAAGSANLLKAVQFVVDTQGNRVLVHGTDSEFARVKSLLEQLDVPTRTVLVEVAIAEISLTSNAQFGVEWLVDNLKLGGKPVAVQTLKGLGIGSGGMSFALNAANFQVVVNALAANNRVQILSTPRVVAKSGGLARIEVGTDVPILTAQRAGTAAVAGTTDIIQQVDYRKTGVILTVKPIIHGDDRVELEIEQELSEAATNPNKSISSPIIINRRVVTQLSVADSMTAVVGGLYSDSDTRGDTGVPGLKEVPLLGQMFRTDSRDGKKTELLVFLRPYIIGGPREMSDLATALGKRFDSFGRQPVVSIDRILGLNKY